MSNINVTVLTPDKRELKCSLPDDVKCGVIEVDLINKYNLPSVDVNKKHIGYQIVYKETEQKIFRTQTLEDLGVKDDDVLELQAELLSDKPGVVICDKCGQQNTIQCTSCIACGNPLCHEDVPVKKYKYPLIERFADRYYSILMIPIVILVFLILSLFVYMYLPTIVIIIVVPILIIFVLWLISGPLINKMIDSIRLRKLKSKIDKEHKL